MNKLNQIHFISSKILIKYNELISSADIVISNGNKEIINELKKLIKEEYELVHSLSITDVKLCLEALRLSGRLLADKSWIRVSEKILDYRETFRNNAIDSSNLGVKNIPGNMKFSTYDVMLSVVDIDTIKKVKDKIYSLVVSCEGDRIFVRSLKKELNDSKLKLLFSGATSEIIALYYDADIDKIPNIDLEVVRKMTNNINLDNLLNKSLEVYATKIINSLAMNTFYNKPEDVFTYLTLLTQIEVIINYINKDMLNKLYEYCNSSNKSNNNIEKVKKLILEKGMEDNKK